MAILNGKIIPIQSDIIKVGMRLTSKTISNVIYNLAESTSMTGQSEQYFPICSDGCSYDEDIVDGVLATTKQFSIVLPDNECGESRLAELQAVYSDLVIEEGAPTGSASQAITLSGVSGNAK